MTTRFMVRAALATATFAFSFVLTPAFAATSAQTAPANMPMACDSPGMTAMAAAMDCPGCKQVYRTEHHGAPGKGVEMPKLVRVECLTRPTDSHR